MERGRASFYWLIFVLIFNFLIKRFKRIVSGGRAMPNLEGVRPFPVAVGGCPFWY